MLFRRFSFELSATKRQNRNLKKESCDLHQPTWLLRCAVVPCCSHVFRNDRRTLHVQPFVIAYPQAHLVSRLYRKYFIPGDSPQRRRRHRRRALATSPAGGGLKKNRPFWPFEKKIDVLDRFAPFRNVFYPFSTVLDQIIPPFWVV